MRPVLSLAGLLLVAGSAIPLAAQSKLPPVAARTFFDPATYAPPLTAPYVTARSELRDLVSRYLTDRAAVQRLYPAGGAERSPRLRAFYHGWLQALPTVDFGHLSHEGQVDYVLLRNRIEYDLLLLGREERMAGAGAPPPVPDTGPVTGTPVGRETLIEDLKNEMVAYTPEQFLEIGKREYEWTENEMKKAAREMGFGDDWHAALEKVKNAYVPRGAQPGLVRDLEIQGEDFVRQHDLVTIPNQAHDAWRMSMMTPQAMRTAPFFLGGESIQVSYPTEGMTDSLAMMIMKGNGPHLSHATVFHEMIPGHELQGFMADRYNAHRRSFGSPFYVEGWALYWEMQLWEKGFHATPEDRIGALFWRMHRAARILFTLNFHLGNWTAQQCVDFLIANGHERWTAESEVRGHMRLAARTPLYQAGYLMGALQLRSIYREVVVEKKLMTEKQFNDAVMHEGAMPMEMLRNALEGLPLTRDYTAQWKYYGDVPASATLSARPAAPAAAPASGPLFPPDLTDYVSTTSELRDVVLRYDADRSLLLRFYNVAGSAERNTRLRAFYAGWRSRVAPLAAAGGTLSPEGRADARMLMARVDHEVALLDRETNQQNALAPLLPFASEIARLQEDRQRLDFITPDAAVAALASLRQKIVATRDGAGASVAAPALAQQAAQQLDVLRGALSAWYTFFFSYDPLFTARVPGPFAAVDSALTSYSGALRARAAGLLPGQPIGRAAMLEELRSEMIPFTPEQLLAVAGSEVVTAEARRRDVTVSPLAAAVIGGDTTAAGLIRFVRARYGSHRSTFESAVTREGLQAYWHDDGATRRRNAARLMVAVHYHLGDWTVQQGADTLVLRGGFERAAADAEMRRIAASGSVLSGAGATIGAVQLRELRRSIVEVEKRMTERQFDDVLLREGPMPVALLRELMTPGSR